jgi:hypothetical protein
MEMIAASAMAFREGSERARCMGAYSKSLGFVHLPLRGPGGSAHVR